MLVRDHVDQALHALFGRDTHSIRSPKMADPLYELLLRLEHVAKLAQVGFGCPSGSSCRGGCCAASRFSSALFITSCQNWSSSICDGGISSFSVGRKVEGPASLLPPPTERGSFSIAESTKSSHEKNETKAGPHQVSPHFKINGKRKKKFLLLWIQWRPLQSRVPSDL